MVIDFTTQTGPVLWVLFALLLLFALVIFACVDPESAEVFFGDLQLLVATVALAAVAIVVLSGRVKISREIGPPADVAVSHADAGSP